jgi:hypothetical protein
MRKILAVHSSEGPALCEPQGITARDEGSCATVIKPEDLGKDPRVRCLYLREKATR